MLQAKWGDEEALTNTPQAIRGTVWVSQCVRKGCQHAAFTLSGLLCWQSYSEGESKCSFRDSASDNTALETEHKSSLWPLFSCLFFLCSVKSDVTQALSFLLVCFSSLATLRLDFLTLMLLNLAIVYSGVRIFPLLSFLFGNVIFLIKCVSFLLLVNSWIFHQIFFLSFTCTSPSGSSITHILVSPLLSSVSFNFSFMPPFCLLREPLDVILQFTNLFLRCVCHFTCLWSSLVYHIFLRFWVDFSLSFVTISCYQYTNLYISGCLLWLF